MRTKKEKIAFEKFFNRSLRRRAINFLESGKPVATLTKGVLLVAALGGVLAIGIMAPNLFRAFRIDSREYGRKLNREGFKRVRRSCYQLQRSGLIEIFPDKKGNILWRITQKGKAALEKLLGISNFEKNGTALITKIKAPLQWDRKWRLIFFDIPIDFNSARNALRRELRSFGCYQLQQSVFAHPFSCVQEIAIVAHHLNITRYIEVCTVEDFANKNAIAFFKPLLEQYEKA